MFWQNFKLEKFSCYKYDVNIYALKIHVQEILSIYKNGQEFLEIHTVCLRSLVHFILGKSEVATNYLNQWNKGNMRLLLTH